MKAMKAIEARERLVKEFFWEPRDDWGTFVNVRHQPFTAEDWKRVHPAGLVARHASVWWVDVRYDGQMATCWTTDPTELGLMIVACEIIPCHPHVPA